jgi:hypothetical protein
MSETTMFYDAETEGFIKMVPRLIPNLCDSAFIELMKDKEHGYYRTRYKIKRIETVIGDGVDTIIQNVMVTKSEL